MRFLYGNEAKALPHSQHIDAIVKAFPDLIPDDILSELFGHASKILPSSHARRDNIVDVPLFGSIAADQPLEMLANEERYPLPISIFHEHPESFFLKIEGESMNRVLPNDHYALMNSKIDEGDPRRKSNMRSAWITIRRL